jgi:hypothetical protein
MGGKTTTDETGTTTGTLDFGTLSARASAESGNPSGFVRGAAANLGVSHTSPGTIDPNTGYPDEGSSWNASARLFPVTASVAANSSGVSGGIDASVADVWAGYKSDRLTAAGHLKMGSVGVAGNVGTDGKIGASAHATPVDLSGQVNLRSDRTSDVGVFGSAYGRVYTGTRQEWGGPQLADLGESEVTAGSSFGVKLGVDRRNPNDPQLRQVLATVGYDRDAGFTKSLNLPGISDELDTRFAGRISNTPEDVERRLEMFAP